MLFAQFDFSVWSSGLEYLFSLLLIGGVLAFLLLIGGVLALLIPVLLFVFLRKKRRRGAPQSADAKQAASGPPPVTPSTDVQQLDNRITPVKLHCPQCNQLLEVAESMSGQVITCPACSGDLRIPAMVENEPTRQESRPAPHQEAITKSRNRDAGRQYWSKAFKAQFFISIGLFVCACILPVDHRIGNNEMTGFTCLLFGFLLPHMWAPNPIYLTAIVLAIKHRYLGAAIVGSIATLWAICVGNVSYDFSGAPPFWCASMLVLTVGCFIQWRKECDDDGLTDADGFTAGTDPTNAGSDAAPGMSADELRLAKEQRRARNKKILKWGLPTIAIISLLVLITNYRGPFEYQIEDGVVTIIGCEENLAGELTIPATIRGKPVTCIENDTFRDCSRLTAIIIPDSVTRIGGSAFYRCSNLASVTIGNGVTSITGNLFKEHANLKSITIPDSVTSIGENAFNGCSSLTSITLPDSVTSIGKEAFEGCSSLTSITIPDGVTSIEEGVFDGCKSLTSITIPNGVTSIGRYAFYGCAGLTSITFGENSQLASIGERAFRDCSSLTSIMIPDSVTSIGSAFRGCHNLTSITIPDSVTSIGEYAFDGCAGLTSITIPDNVTSIGEKAFLGCHNLTSITIGNGVTSIGERAFLGCRNLTSITIPDSVTSIGRYAFDGCTNLTSITIGNGVTSIVERAFSECSSLTSITIPDSVTSIGSGAFNGCSSLTSITIPGSITSIGFGAFSGCDSLTSITIPDSVTSIGPNAFQGCSSLTAVTFLGDAPKDEKDIFKGSTPIIYRKPGAKGWSRSWSARLVERIAIQGGANINGLDESVGEVDFDNPETRKKIVADAIYRTQSEWRGDEGEERLYFRDYQMPYSGWWKEMRGKGNGYHIASLVQYKDGKRDGPMANWYKNGKKRLEHIYKDGKLHGLSRGWYRNGNKRRERTYKDGELMSIVDWKPDGEKFSGSKLVSIFKTGNVKNAGSDGLVMHAHIIGLDESRSSLGRLDNIDVNDREAGSTDVYSLPFNYPVAEIQGVELVVVKGNDSWRAETISFQFYDGGKKSKPYAFEVNQWFSADKKDLDSIGAIKSRMFSFQPAFEANQSPAP